MRERTVEFDETRPHHRFALPFEREYRKQLPATPKCFVNEVQLLRRNATRVAIKYHVSEKAHVIVYVNGRRDVVGGAGVHCGTVPRGGRKVHGL